MELFNKNNLGERAKFGFDKDLESIYLFDKLFYRNLKDSKLRESPSNFIDHKKYKDITIEYAYNNLGYRGIHDIDGTEDLLILGCSQTYGTGLPLHLTWGDIFARNIDKKYALLAQEGDSIQSQVYKCFKYFEEFGHPKIIAAVLPLTRLEFPHIPGKSGSNFGKGEKETNNYPRIMQSFGHVGDPIKISALPHDIDEILPREFYTFYGFMFMQMLEQYCKVNNIILIWNCYQDKVFIDYLKENQPEVLKNYLYFDYSDVIPKVNDVWDELPFDVDEYGLEFSMLPDYNKNSQYKSLFYRAADFQAGKSVGHWGAYPHKYIAELFYLEYKNRISSIE